MSWNKSVNLIEMTENIKKVLNSCAKFVFAIIKMIQTTNIRWKIKSNFGYLTKKFEQTDNLGNTANI